MAAFKLAHQITPANGVAGPSFDAALKAAISAQESDVPTGTRDDQCRRNRDRTGRRAGRWCRRWSRGANSIIDTSYCVRRRPRQWNSSCYDCSGSVSFVLHGAGLLSQSEDSTGLESYGRAGPGKWVTIYTDPSHAFIVIGGRAFDTADYGGPNIPAGTGPRWRRTRSATSPTAATTSCAIRLVCSA